jgi:hypothetical protein
VGDRRDARTAGYRPASAPISTVAVTPPARTHRGTAAGLSWSNAYAEQRQQQRLGDELGADLTAVQAVPRDGGGLIVTVLLPRAVWNASADPM